MESCIGILLTPVGRDYPSEQYTAVFSSGETRAQVAVTVFDDNVTEGIENFTAILHVSEYSLSLGVRLRPNSSAAIIYLEDNGESVHTSLVVNNTAIVVLD